LSIRSYTLGADFRSTTTTTVRRNAGFAVWITVRKVWGAFCLERSLLLSTRHCISQHDYYNSAKEHGQLRRNNGSSVM